MAVFLKHGDAYKISSREALDLHDTLPGGNFTLAATPDGTIFLQKVEDFEVKHKLYGDVAKQTRRILHTFEDRENSTGVLLAGEKGSGKTLLAKNICFEAAKKGIPAIIINAPWHGDNFNRTIQGIEQPAIVLFDEFEKVYDQEHQPAILTLLDGVFPSRKLFVLTCNNKWRVDEHMRNRPGRIFYMMDFTGLDENFIREYCEDNLNDKQHIDRIVQISGTFHQFNFDMLKALIEEMNRFHETPNEALNMLNVKVEYSAKQQFSWEFFYNGKQIDPKDADMGAEMEMNPLQATFQFDWYGDKLPGEDDDREYMSTSFNVQHLKKIENGGKRYTFANEEGAVIILNKKDVYSYKYNYDAW